VSDTLPEHTAMSRSIIHTARAPAAIGTYSQAVRAGNTVYLSGQTPLDPATGQMVVGPIEVHIRRVFDNLKAVAEAAGGDFTKVVKLHVFLTDLSNFAKLSEVMQEYFEAPFPARSTIEVKGLPRGAEVEMDMIMVLDD
jgi:reactive intermediate/imine deaminase